MEISKESWDALYRGQLRDCERIMDLEERLGDMALQIERLSWMVEYLSNDETSLGEAEVDWEREQMYRIALEERREADGAVA